MAVKGLMTVLRVLPDDLYQLVMESDEPVEKGCRLCRNCAALWRSRALRAAPKMTGM